MGRRQLAWTPACCGGPAYVSALRAAATDVVGPHRICRVTCVSPPVEGVCTSKHALWCYGASEVYRAFARAQALRITHLWDAPPVVVQYLKTGDESIRDAAYRAAWPIFDPRILVERPWTQREATAKYAARAAIIAASCTASYSGGDAVEAGGIAASTLAEARGAIGAFTPHERAAQVIAPDLDEQARGLAEMLTRGRGIYGQRRVP